jgi:large subunit ribosomal protein L25
VKLGAGLISHVMSEVDVACLPKDLPEYIQVDLSGLQAHQTVRVLDLKLPAGVTPVLKGKENPVVAAVSTHGEQEVEEETAAPVAAADVPATAQKAPVEAPGAAPAKGGKEGKEAKEAKGDKKK